MKAVKSSAQNVAKAIRRNERVLKAPTTASKKRTSPTEATQIEPTITPASKVPRTIDKTSPGGRADGAKTSGITQPGADKNTIQQTQTSVKLRGTQNPKVRQAIQKGREEHAKLKAKIKEKSQKKSGWQSEERIENKRTGEIVIPDGITPSRRPLELKPNTPSGRKQGAKQLKKYEDATGKKGRVIYYDPNK